MRPVTTLRGKRGLLLRTSKSWLENPAHLQAACSAYDCSIPARGKGVVKTDLAVAVPSGTYGRVAPRSGLAVKHFIDTGAGVIDEDYRGPVGVVLFNHSDVAFESERVF